MGPETTSQPRTITDQPIRPAAMSDSRDKGRGVAGPPTVRRAPWPASVKIQSATAAHKPDSRDKVRMGVGGKR